MNLKLETQANFEKGMRRYQPQNFVEAKHFYNEVLAVHPGDRAALLYMERVTRFLEEGVPEGWEGVTGVTEK